ncbi:MAG: hypothetical protein CMN30_21465 [Sandaracinus sp.]|nr:hypothetical protein [Sandaracinus sp.]MAQ17351.1 hypothetical protein [Sandaracinus sp.]|tara:strand:+ start:722 stop:958 length:237 start_codon:yes stop_codon:yes gene_type:complete
MKVEPIEFSKDLLHVVAERPCAPGTPVKLEVGELSLNAKSHGTKKRADGRFDLRVRLIGLQRGQRRALLAMLTEAPPG